MHFSRDAGSAFLDEGTAFIALAWQELFDPATPDSYRPRLYDTHGLVEELASLADLASQDERWSRHLELVQNELRWAAKFESCWLSHEPWSASIIQRISSATELGQIKDLAALFVSASPNPVTQLFKCLHRETSTLPANKEKSLAVLNLLGTQAIRRQLAAEDVALDLHDVEHDNHIAILERLQGQLEAQTRPFRCIVHLRGNASHVHSLFGNNGFQQARKQDFPLDLMGQAFKETISRQTAFRYDTTAVSHLAAAAIAVQACRRVIDLFNLYQNRASIELDPNILVVDGTRTSIVSRQTEQSLATQPSRAAPRLTREVLHGIPFDDHDLGLENSLEQHSLGGCAVENGMG